MEGKEAAMIVTFRIDERLIHGQVIATWLKALGVTHLIVANDDAASNSMRQTALKLAIPKGVKCLIKGIDDATRIVNDPRCNEMRVMLIAGTPEDAVKLVGQVPGIKEINLANYGSITKPDIKGKLTISGMVYLDNSDIQQVNKLIDTGLPVFTQKTPTDPKKLLSKINEREGE